MLDVSAVAGHGAVPAAMGPEMVVLIDMATIVNILSPWQHSRAPVTDEIVFELNSTLPYYINLYLSVGKFIRRQNGIFLIFHRK